MNHIEWNCSEFDKIVPELNQKPMNCESNWLAVYPKIHTPLKVWLSTSEWNYEFWTLRQWQIDYFCIGYKCVKPHDKTKI